MKRWFNAQAEECWDNVGGLSKPSKMPCYSYSIPAYACKIGAALAKIAGSVCFKCYAMRGNYLYPHVKEALERRLASISTPEWVESMAYLINHYSEKTGVFFFRWHDSGDLQSMEHLLKIVQICRLTPNVKHWLPTREHNLIREYINSYGEFPDNLTVRLSALMIDGKLPEIMNLPVSTVHYKNAPSAEVNVCPAYSQNGKCLDCRACWNKEIKCVSYKKH